MNDPFGAHRLPRGRHGLAREDVAESQRWRLLASVGEVVSAGGFPAATARRVCAHAGVSSTTFYEHYEDLDACLMTAHAVAVDCIWELVTAASAEAGGSAASVRSALDAACAFILSEPGFARLLCLDLVAGVPAIAAARERDLHRLEQLEALCVGGILVLFGDLIAAGRSEAIPALAGELSELLGDPYFTSQ